VRMSTMQTDFMRGNDEHGMQAKRRLQWSQATYGQMSPGHRPSVGHRHSLYSVLDMDRLDTSGPCLNAVSGPL